MFSFPFLKGKSRI